MSHKHLYYTFIAILVFILVLGCFIAFYPKGKSDAVKFKEEYEQYNDTMVKLSIDKDNPFVYRDEKQIEKIIKNNTGMIFIGNANSDISRKTVKLILRLAKENEVKKIYYLDNTNITSKSLKKYIDNKDAIIFVISGEIVSEFTENEIDKMEIMGRNIEGEINYYMQQTFNEFCDQTCDD